MSESISRISSSEEYTEQNLKEAFVIDPVFDTEAVAIVFQASNLFCPYTAVAIQSIIENTTSEYNYDIIVTSLDINEENTNKISSLSKDRSNISIRVFNISEYRKSYPLQGNKRFGSETWTRIFLMDILPKYKKVIDLDSDMIIQADIGKLFETDVSNYCLAGVRDLFVFYSYYGSYINGKFKTYLKEKIEIENVRDYVNAGCLIFNLEKIRQIYTIENILKIINKKKFDILEQDTFNYIFKGKILHLDMEWNYLVDVIDITGYADRNAPDDLKKLHEKASKNIKIIHYAAPRKPWDFPEDNYALNFWEYARRTPYYACLLYRMIGNQQKRLSLKIDSPSAIISQKFVSKLLPKGSRRREMIKKLRYKFKQK